MNKDIKEPIEPILSKNEVRRSGETTFVAMRHRNYQLYFGGQLISNIGTWMQVIAQAWVVYQLGHSELTLGLVAFASAIPNLIVSPWGGVIVDRISRRKVLIMTQSGAMVLSFILAWLTFTNIVQEWHVILLAALTGVITAFDAPARQAITPELVGKKDVANAIAMNSMMFNSARVVGPAIGGMMLATVGAAWCFTVNGISFLAVLIGLWLMKLPPHRKSAQDVSPWKQLVGGLQYAASNIEISTLILLSLVFSIFGVSYTTVLPAFVEKNLQLGATAFGWVNAVTGLGAVTGAFLLVHRISNNRRGLFLIVTNIAFPVTLIAFAVTAFYPLSLVLAYLLGLGFMVQFTTINTLLQARVEDDFRGRVMGLYTLSFFGFSPFGNLLMGALGEKFGLTFVMILFGILSLVLSRLVLARNPGIKALP
ncbi:MAG TPA: MFS transporter [Anaerolineales bacterium]|nr:MFS transporter [Anaerolineales bacterium]HNF95174.1 MFS transporter [Anaerolineales bacterium]